jgi:hypothetical protein
VVGLFKQKSPGNIIILLLFGLLIKIPMFLYAKPVVSTAQDGNLYRALVSGISFPDSSNASLAAIIAYLLIYIQAMLLNFTMNEYRMAPKQNYLVAMSYLLITSLLPEWNYLSAPLVAATFVIAMFTLIFGLYNIASARGRIYNIGLIAGISSFIFFPSALFIVCILLGLMILKPFRLNEIFLFLMGCLTPYYFYAVYLFLSDNLTLASLFPQFDLSIPTVKSSIWLAISTSLLTVPFLVGGYHIQVNLRKMLIQVRKNWSVMLLYLFLSLFVPYINNAETFHTWVLVAAPFAAFHAGAYYYAPKWIANLLFFLTLGYILFQQYYIGAWGS